MQLECHWQIAYALHIFYSIFTFYSKWLTLLCGWLGWCMSVFVTHHVTGSKNVHGLFAPSSLIRIYRSWLITFAREKGSNFHFAIFLSFSITSIVFDLMPFTNTARAHSIISLHNMPAVDLGINMFSS